MKQKSNEEIKNNENIKMKEKHKVNWFQALCCLLFWIILIKLFIYVCLKIGGLVGLISSM